MESTAGSVSSNSAVAVKSALPGAWVTLLGGAAGGTFGALATCPLEVVKTRMQTSLYLTVFVLLPYHCLLFVIPTDDVISHHVYSLPQSSTSVLRSMNMGAAFRHIVKTEGAASLWKGVGPNLIGVAPGRALYFFSYTRAKEIFGPLGQGDVVTQLSSATAASFFTATITNPLWMIKTQLQLDTTARKEGLIGTAKTVIRRIYTIHGVPGFWKGVTASYAGALETSIQFTLYEQFRKLIHQHHHISPAQKLGSVSQSSTNSSLFIQYSIAAALSKLIASIASYPHEVVRTRLRETAAYDAHGDMKYKRFFQTLFLVAREEGRAGLYGGMTVHLIRTVPNAAILFLSFEYVSYLLA